jgi:predicted RNA binding protein YcfA (HicA-like mRNA interferase family)
VPTKPAELRRISARKGTIFVEGRGSHLKVRLGARATVLPMHNRDIPTGTFHAILRDLGLTKADLEE